MKSALFLALAGILCVTAPGCRSVDALLKQPQGRSARAHAPTRGYDENVAAARDRGKTSLDRIVTIDPAPGMPKIGPTRPSWCDGIPPELRASARASWATSRMETVKQEGSLWGHSPIILLALCASPDDAEVKEQTGHFLQSWVNLTGLSVEQLIPFFRLFADGFDGPTRYRAAVTEACRSFPQPDQEAPPRDRDLAAIVRAALGCTNNEGTPGWITGGTPVVDGRFVSDVSWHIDAGVEPPSEIVRSHLVLSCLVDRTPLRDEDLIAYTVCGADARALSAEKLEQEIAGYPPVSQALARQQHSIARLLARRYEEQARAKGSGDAAWKSILYDAPEKAWKEWEALYAANRKGVDDARGYEKVYAGPSRSAAKGCWSVAWGHVKAHVARNEVRTVLDAKRAMTGPIATILLEHVVACAKAEGYDVAYVPLRQLFSSARPSRGPRFATFFAVLDALNEIKKDRPKFPVESLGSHFEGRSPVAESGAAQPLADLDLANDKGGVVKSLKRQGDDVLVEFTTERFQEDMYKCENTSQILMFRSDGTPVYQRQCKHLGKEWVDRTHPPALVPALFIADMKPGTFVRLFGADGGAWYAGAPEPTRAVPIEVWDGKEKRRLLSYLGISF